MRIWHKDLLEFLPYHLIYEQYLDVQEIKSDIDVYSDIRDPLCKRIMEYSPEHFYTFCVDILVPELTKWKIPYNYQTFEIKSDWYWYTKLDPFMPTVDRDRLFDGWHTTRYLQQCILILEEMYDCKMIEYKDWFKIINGVRYMNKFCNDTYESLFV